MITSFFNSAFFGGEFFNSDAFKTGGKGDNEKRRRDLIFKPTGLIDRPQSKVEERVNDSAQIHARVIADFEKTLEVEAAVESNATPIREMTRAEVDFEIGVLMRKQIRTEDEELTLLLLMAS